MMRRSGQALPHEESETILRQGRVCTLAVAGDEGWPYAVPLNYVYDGEAVYIHCARQGHKTDALRRSPKCSLCVIDADRIVPETFTTHFRSVIAFGRAEFVEERAERIRALRLLADKYAAGFDPTAEIDRFIETVAIVRITIETLTGKQAVELTHSGNDR